jgi:16S rRNA (guanine1207-N2)-methyltransferase
MTITLTDLPRRECTQEEFRNGAFAVLSRSGLHPTESALLAALPPKISGHALVIGNRTGVTGLILATENPALTVTQHVLDAHHAHTLTRTLTVHNATNVPVVCTPFLPENPAPTFAVIQATSHDSPAEVLLDQLEDLWAKMAENATCLVAYDGQPDWLRKQMKKLFGAVSAIPAAKDVTLFRAVKKTFADSGATHESKRRDFSATFNASLPGDPAVTLMTLPGVFSHRRPDDGGTALAEVVARDLQPNDRLLDMGCGSGMVGILLARHAPLADVLAVDANTRAIHCTERNARAAGLTNLRAVLTDTGVTETGFTVFVGNPPYYSEYKIAELFVRTAHAALAPNGRAYLVAKNHRWLTEFMQELFGNTELIMRRGYGIVKSVR